jgi:hypothetical protein
MAFINGDSGLTTATATGAIDAFEDYLATDRVPFVQTNSRFSMTLCHGGANAQSL